MAVLAEDAGFDGVMFSEHVALGPSANERGQMENPREYALPGNQAPDTPWPSSLVMLAAIAAATTRLRLAAAAIIAPLRHPILLAKDLATLDLLSEGRLTVLPTVSWHRDEYVALDVPYERRGALLDEHLLAWKLLWRDTPASFDGSHYRFRDVHLEPKPFRPDGPRLWFGGHTLHPRLLRRLIDHGHGFNPLGRPRPDELERLAAGMAEAGRDIAELELIGGTRATFVDPRRPAPLAPALATIPEQRTQGFTSFCIKPSQFIDDPAEFAPWCREVIRRVADE
jgi:probable F420-dependent oxidoreductase